MNSDNILYELPNFEANLAHLNLILSKLPELNIIYIALIIFNN